MLKFDLFAGNLSSATLIATRNPSGWQITGSTKLHFLSDAYHRSLEQNGLCNVNFYMFFILPPNLAISTMLFLMIFSLDMVQSSISMGRASCSPAPSLLPLRMPPQFQCLACKAVTYQINKHLELGISRVLVGE